MELSQGETHVHDLVAEITPLPDAANHRGETLRIQFAQNAQQQIFGTANWQSNKEMKYPTLAIQFDTTPRRMTVHLMRRLIPMKQKIFVAFETNAAPIFLSMRYDFRVGLQKQFAVREKFTNKTGGF